MVMNLFKKMKKKVVKAEEAVVEAVKGKKAETADKKTASKSAVQKKAAKPVAKKAEPAKKGTAKPAAKKVAVKTTAKKTASAVVKKAAKPVAKKAEPAKKGAAKPAAKKAAAKTMAKKTDGKTAVKKTAAAKKTPAKTVSEKTAAKKAAVKKKSLIDTVVSKLEDGKAVDLISIDLNGRASFADYLVIASGTSSRHVMALVQNLARDLKTMGIAARIEGMEGEGNWVVLDLNSIVVHVFNPESRSYYDLEGMWQRK